MTDINESGRNNLITLRTLGRIGVEKSFSSDSPRVSSENSIGISEYATISRGFEGIIKQRISDFHVNEIDIDGIVCKLTDFSLPRNLPTTNVEEIDAEQCIRLIKQENYDAVAAIERADAGCSDSISIDVTEMDKAERTLIHQTVKSVFNTIVSSTYDADSKKFIKCSKLAKKSKHERRSKWQWPHEYTYFLLHKENIDTMHAVSMLASLINVKPASISYAGTKDKRGKTTQWACVKRREPSQIVRAAQRARQMFVGNFVFRDKPLKLGNSLGNRFRIALRQITATQEHIDDALNHFKNNGFINYYGHQRFGISSTTPTHQIGLALLQSKFEKACELIMKPRENDGHDMSAARESWMADRDAAKALQLLRNYDKRGVSIEHKLLSGFVKFGPNDYLNALQMIPRNTRLMYIHAYQSLIWNEIASKRVAEYGLKLCVGDLVYADTLDSMTHILEEAIDAEHEGDLLHPDETSTEDESKISDFRSKVRPLTEADLKSNKYTIFDVVLPLPGHDITYPLNEISQWYEKRLLQNDLSSEKLKLKQKVYSLTGAYRKLLVKPDNVDWHIMGYNHESDSLIRSDIEELRGCSEPKSVKDGSLRALILEFNLPPSSYATMALREITKSDTSTAYQIQLQTNSSENSNNSGGSLNEPMGPPAKKPRVD